MIGIVKANKKVFCKENIENFIKDWPGGSYLMLRSKTVVPWGRPLIAIRYRYNAQKVLCFIVTDNTGNTQAVLTYLSKCLGQFPNASVRPVAC